MAPLGQHAAKDGHAGHNLIREHELLMGHNPELGLRNRYMPIDLLMWGRVYCVGLVERIVFVLQHGRTGGGDACLRPVGVHQQLVSEYLPAIQQAWRYLVAITVVSVKIQNIFVVILKELFQPHGILVGELGVELIPIFVPLPKKADVNGSQRRGDGSELRIVYLVLGDLAEKFCRFRQAHGEVVALFGEVLGPGVRSDVAGQPVQF